MTINLTMPWPPSTNTYYRMVPGKRHPLLSAEGRAYQDRCRWLAAEAKVDAIEGSVALTLVLHPPDRRRRDIDNVLKALLDALHHGGIIVDDSQIVELHAWMQEPVKGGLAIAKVESIR